MLTTGIDAGAAFVGTEKNDIFIGSVSATTALNTLNAMDTIDGGAGIDTLKVLDETGTVVVPNMSNIEIIEVSGFAASGLDVDTTATTGVTDLNIIKTAGDIDAKAGSTTDVTVNMKAAGNAVGIDGGKDVTVKLTDVATTTDIVTIGGGTVSVAPTGDVTVDMTGAAYTAATANTTLSAINVTGGKTISVTQKATSDSSAAATDTANTTITQGAVTVIADENTTTVTVKQDAAVTAVDADETTGGVTETASVKFGALTSGETVILGGLTLEANADMTAAEVAAAFANLSADAVIPSDATPAAATGDTQGSAAASKGVFSGSINGWTTGAASGDTVVFTSTTANGSVTDLSDTGSATTDVAITTTQGKAHDATPTGGVMGVVAGQVNVTGEAALTTVTVDGYSATGSDIKGATNTALATINLKNGGAFTVSDTADTVTLTLEKVTGATTFTAAAEPKTLNVKSIGDNTGVIAAANTTAFNVSGTGTLTQSGSLADVKTITVTETAGLNLTGATLTDLESIDATATTGAVTASILGAQTTYAGSKGVDTVTVTDATSGTAGIAKAIDLGAGDDKLILSGTSVKVPTVELKGGEGTDTLSINAASAAALGGNTLFAAKLNSFERLEITDATGNQSVDVKNLGFANYVTVAGVATSGTLTLNDLANNATVVINEAVADGVTTNIKDADDATLGTADVLNLEITNEDSIDAGTLTANNIETVNLTVTDVFTDEFTDEPTNTVAGSNGIDDNDATHSMTFTSDTTTALNVAGTAGLDLTLTNADKLVTIDASDMTEGGLEVTANGKNAMTITGGAGDDVLTASTGTDAKADILVGGAGNDTLVAGTNGASLTGGTGNDLFVLVATGASTGNKEATTHSYITDFQAGDLLQLKYWDSSAVAVVESFSKLAANMSVNAVYTDYVNAAMEQMATTTAGTAGDAVWFSFAGNSYVIVDSGTETTGTFTNGEDLVIELTGVANLNGASFNSDFGTIAIG